MEYTYSESRGSSALFLPHEGHSWALASLRGQSESLTVRLTSRAGSSAWGSEGSLSGQGWDMELSDYSSEHGTSQS